MCGVYTFPGLDIRELQVSPLHRHVHRDVGHYGALDGVIGHGVAQRK